MEQTRTLRYTGSPTFAGLFAQTLRDEGVVVEYEPPFERRDAASMVEAVTVFFICRGSEVAIKAAVDKWRARSRGKVEEVGGED